MIPRRTMLSCSMMPTCTRALVGPLDRRRCVAGRSVAQPQTPRMSCVLFHSLSEDTVTILLTTEGCRAAPRHVLPHAVSARASARTCERADASLRASAHTAWAPAGPGAGDSLRTAWPRRRNARRSHVERLGAYHRPIGCPLCT